MYREKNGVLIYDGVVSSDHLVWIEGGGTFNAASRRFEVVTVPGRYGALTIDTGVCEEIAHPYQCFIGKGFPEYFEAFRNAIMARTGYKRLEDSYHPDEFYMARYMTGLEADVAPLARGGKFELTFQRDPRRFLKAGETAREFTAAGEIENPTSFASKPLIRVYGYGTLELGDVTITISQGLQYIDIDSEMMDCFSGLVNANGLVAFSENDFPVLQPGKTGVEFSGNITSVEITPRWWRL